jgi:hypothetical protein
VIVSSAKSGDLSGKEVQGRTPVGEWGFPSLLAFPGRQVEKALVGEKEKHMNTPLEYILVGIVAVGILVYLAFALLAPEKF